MFDFASDQRPKLNLTEIIVAPDRAREDYSAVPDIAESIRNVGLIHPIVVSKRPDGKYDLVCGATRLRACLLVPEMGGKVPYSMYNGNPIDLLKRKEMELEEDVKRQAKSSIEMLRNVQQITEIKTKLYGKATIENPEGWSLKKTAQLIGVSETTAQVQVKLAKKLHERPELVEQVRNLPISSMTRVIENIEEAEKVGRLHASGQLTLTEQLVNMDCREWLAGLKENSVDLWLTDPPFGMDTLESNATNISSGGNSFTSVMKENDNLSSLSALKLMKEALPLMFRALKPSKHTYIFFELELLGELKLLIQDAGFKIQWPVIIWDKGRTTSVFKGYAYAPAYEGIFYCFKPDASASPCRRLSEPCSSVLRYPSLDARKKQHIFEKPQTLLTELIKVSTNHGDIVGDPFAGSGSTLLTAKQMGRGMIGCELNQEHFLRAQNRLLMDGLIPKEVAK